MPATATNYDRQKEREALYPVTARAIKHSDGRMTLAITADEYTLASLGIAASFGADELEPPQWWEALAGTDHGKSVAARLRVISRAFATVH